jgi:hypothetical protein
MPDKAKTAEQARQELGSERERLGTAIDDLRTEVDALKRKLPYVAAAAVATMVVLGVVRRKLSR